VTMALAARDRAPDGQPATGPEHRGP